MDEKISGDKKQDLTLEKLSLEGRTAKKESIFQKHFGVIIMALASLVAALISGTQIVTTHIVKSNELEIVRLNNEAEEERQWRIALSKFLSEHRSLFFSKNEAQREEILAMLKLTFPSRYAEPVLNKFTVIAAKKDNEVAEKQIFDELLKPLVSHLNRRKELFQLWTMEYHLSEAKLIQESNIAARNLLVNNSHLIPEELGQTLCG